MVMIVMMTMIVMVVLDAYMVVCKYICMNVCIDADDLIRTFEIGSTMHLQSRGAL